MRLLNLARVNAHVVQVTVRRRHVCRLFGFLQREELVAQRGFHVDRRGVAGPRGHGAARVEHAGRVVHGVGCERHGRGFALVHNGHDRVLGEYRARAHLGLQRRRRNVAVPHAAAQLLGALLLAIRHPVGHAIKRLLGRDSGHGHGHGLDARTYLDCILLLYCNAIIIFIFF